MKTMQAIGMVVAILLAPALSASGAQLPENARECLVYFGTYTKEDSKGIYAYRFDVTTGKLTSLGLAAETPNPTFFETDAARRRLFSVNEIDQFEGKPGGAVSAFAIVCGSGAFASVAPSRPTVRPCCRNQFWASRIAIAANHG